VDFLRGDYISALRGCCPLKFLNMLETDQALNGDGGPPKTFDRENLKFCQKFRVLAPITSGILGVFSHNFSGQHSARHRSLHVYNFWSWKAGPQIFGRVKKLPKFGEIFDNFRF